MTVDLYMAYMLMLGLMTLTLMKVTVGRQMQKFSVELLSRPDMTFAVDWALKTNYLSIYQLSKQQELNLIQW